MVRDWGEGAPLILARFAGKDGLLVVEPVNDKREIVERHCRAEWDIGDRVDGSYDVESEMVFVLAREAVAPQTTDVVLTVGEEHVGNTTSVGLSTRTCTCNSGISLRTLASSHYKPSNGACILKKHTPPVGCTYMHVCTVEPLYKDTPEMRTSPLIRTPCMVPAT